MNGGRVHFRICFKNQVLDIAGFDLKETRSLGRLSKAEVVC